MIRRTTAWVAALMLLAGGCGGSQQPSATDQVPQLGAMLDRVDAALVAHRDAAARTDLRALKTAAVKARNAGQLRDADATRVLDAVSRLMTQLPDVSSTPTQAPTTTRSSSPSPSPTKTASSHPAKPKSTTAKPSASPTTTPPSASPTPSASPSAPASSPTAQISPAAASVTPSP